MSPTTNRWASIRVRLAAITVASLLALLGFAPVAQAQATCGAFRTRYFVTPWLGSSFGPANLGFHLVYTAPTLVSSYARGSLQNFSPRSWSGLVVQQFFDDRKYGSGAPFNIDMTDRLRVEMLPGASGSPIVIRLGLLSWGGGERLVTAQGCTGNNVLFGTFDDGGGAVVISLGVPAAPHN